MRLQPMHIGHFELISKSSKLGKKTIILIFNSKTRDKENPLPEEKKIKILKKTIELEDLKNIEIISMPYFENSKQRFEFVNKNIKLTNNSLVVSGNEFIQVEFKKLGYLIKTPKEILGELHNISGFELRKLIRTNQKFKHHLSSGTLHYLEELTELK